ncbi:hypothetical protein S40285_06712 [Stachybotrys chlorohalonatus IBT 40285]|uniref:Cytochrome P450 n=1 Tax=Stachybotrys chlorohalonatus (strain IBT 40285) TaxID=1283841 RepID=A0A084QTH6_STAC4|nr:hypothetical protein S40285_06712 [Stachybotrys chlorohalonata IBT 40285]
MSYTSLVLTLATPILLVLIRSLLITMHAPIPGPLLLKHTALPLLYAETIVGSRDRFLTALHKAHGPVVQIAPRHVSVGDIAGVRALSAAGRRLDRNFALPFFHNYGAENLVATVDGALHYERRRPLRSIYAARMAESHELSGVIMSAAQSMVNLARQEARKDGRIEAKRLLHFAILDIMSVVVYGSANRLCTLTDAQQRAAWQPEVDFQTQRILSPAAAVMFLLPSITMWLRKTGLAPHAIADKYPAGHISDTLGRTAWDTMQPHDSSHSHSFESLMHRFYTHFHSNGPTAAVPSVVYILSDCLDHFWAGVTTTTDAMAPLLRHLSKPGNAERQQRLRHEILGSAAEAGVSVTNLSAQQLKQLPFLNAVIRETLRLHPPIAFSIERRVNEKHGISVHGFNIPLGWEVTAPAMAMQKSEHVFLDAAAWCPERWLNHDLGRNVDATAKEELRKMKAHFFAFGSGPRMCLGLNVAYSIMRGLVAGIYGTVKTQMEMDEHAKKIQSSKEQPDSSREQEPEGVLAFVAEKKAKVWLNIVDS